VQEQVSWPLIIATMLPMTAVLWTITILWGRRLGKAQAPFPWAWWALFIFAVIAAIDCLIGIPLLALGR